MGSICRYGKDVLRSASPLVEAAGAHCRIETSTGGHAKLIIEGFGKTRITPVSSSPKNAGDALKMKLADVRRILREMQAA